MLTPNWDVRYEGLMDTGVTLVRIDAAGDDEYDFEFTNKEGIFYDFPLASAEAGAVNLTTGVNDLKYGDDDDDLWFTEFNSTNASGSATLDITPFTVMSGPIAAIAYISDDDFFVLSNCNHAASDNTCFSHVLRYDSIDSTNRQLTFTDLGTGTREVTYDSVTRIANFVVGGVTYLVGVNDTSGNLLVDLNGDGSITDCTEAIIGIQGEGLIDLGDQLRPAAVVGNVSFGANTSCVASTSAATTLNVSLTTLSKEFDESGTDENVTALIVPRATDEIGLQSVSNLTPLSPPGAGLFFGMFDLEENDDIEQALSGYGAFFELYNPSSDDQAEDLTVEYPLSQRGARVFVTGGVVSTTSVAAGGVERVQPIQIGAAKLASEVSDVSMYNAVVVGGPCANPIAASLLGNPEPCYESVTENKAIVKLFEHTNGNVALLVNGRTAMNTRQGARAVATGAIAKVTGMEAEVTGTTLSDVTVKAV